MRGKPKDELVDLNGTNETIEEEEEEMNTTGLEKLGEMAPHHAFARGWLGG